MTRLSDAEREAVEQLGRLAEANSEALLRFCEAVGSVMTNLSDVAAALESAFAPALAAVERGEWSCEWSPGMDPVE